MPVLFGGSLPAFGAFGSASPSTPIPVGALVTVRIVGQAQSSYGVTDTRGNTYTQFGPVDCELWASRLTVALATSDTINIAIVSGPGTAPPIAAEWFTGIAPTAVANAYGTNVGAASATSPVPINAGDLAVVTTEGGAPDGGPSWQPLVIRNTAYPYEVGGAYQIPSSTSTLTFTTANTVNVLMVAFGAGGSTGLTMLI